MFTARERKSICRLEVTMMHHTARCDYRATSLHLPTPQHHVMHVFVFTQCQELYSAHSTTLSHIVVLWASQAWPRIGANRPSLQQTDRCTCLDYCNNITMESIDLLVTTRHLLYTGTATYYYLTWCVECARSYYYTYRPHSKIAIFATSRTSGQLFHTLTPREQRRDANGPAAIERSQAC
jgi:hypothetical protein